MSGGHDLLKSMGALEAAVGVPLSMVGGRITGSIGMKFQNATTIPIPFTPKVKAFFIHDGLGVLYHVAGDLYMIAYHMAKSGAVSVYMVDGAGSTSEHLSEVVATHPVLRELVVTLGKKIVASYYWTGATWSALVLPKY